MSDDRLEQIRDRYRMDLDADEDTILNDLSWLLGELDHHRRVVTKALTVLDRPNNHARALLEALIGDDDE